MILLQKKQLLLTFVMLSLSIPSLAQLDTARYQYQIITKYQPFYFSIVPYQFEIPGLDTSKVVFETENMSISPEQGYFHIKAWEGKVKSKLIIRDKENFENILLKHEFVGVEPRLLHGLVIDIEFLN